MSWKAKITIPLLAKIAPFILRRRRSSKIVTIVAYHRIMDATDSFLFDKEVISASQEDFETQVKFFKEYYSLITFNDLKKIIENDISCPQNPMIITFDDGYRDNYTNAYPILKKYDVPATVFLTVDHIGTNKKFWWDEAVYSFKKEGCGKETIWQRLKELKRMDDADRQVSIEGMRSVYPEELNERMTLNWDEVLEMSQNGIEFGSHTMTHPVLSRIKDEDKLRHEIYGSKKIIEDKLAQEIHALSYPVGGRDSLNEHIKELVREAGYDFAVTYCHGVNDLKDENTDLYNLFRLDMDQEKISRMKAKLLWPGLFKR